MQARAPQAPLPEELTHDVQDRVDQPTGAILLASRLDATASLPLPAEPVDCTALVADECGRAGNAPAALAVIDGAPTRPTPSP